MKIVPVRCEKVDAGCETRTQAWTCEWVQVKTWVIFCVSFHLDGNAQVRGAVVGADADAGRGVRGVARGAVAYEAVACGAIMRGALAYEAAFLLNNAAA